MLGWGLPEVERFQFSINSIAPFGNCCGGQKSRKASQPVKNDIKADAKNDATDAAKNGDITTNGDDHKDKKNPFLMDDIDNDKKLDDDAAAEKAKKEPPVRPRKAMTPMASPAKVGFLVSFLVRF